MTDDLPQLYWPDGVPVNARMTGEPNDYRMAMSGEGPQAAEWQNKPHRLVYDLAGEVLHLRAALDTLTRALAEMTDRARRLGEDSDNRIQRALQLAAETKAALTAMTQERDEARALAGRQSVALAELGDKCSDEFNRAESATAAVREARAETWEAARDKFRADSLALRREDDGVFARVLLGAALSDVANYCDERATAARAGQP